MTGVAGAGAAPGDLEVKRVELLVEAAPGISRVAVLGNPLDFAGERWRAVSARFGVEFVGLPETSRDGFEAAFERARDAGADALLVRIGRGTDPNAPLIARLAERYRLPGTFPNRSYVATGGLMAYEPRRSEVERRAADYVDRILRGERPADLPIELPTRYDLVVNMRTARALGLTFSSTFFDQVTEVIE